MRMMAEEVTLYRDDLEADSKRHLLSALTACIPQVLPFLEHSMEAHFGQAVAAGQQGQHQLSQLHAAVVTAALGKPSTVYTALASQDTTDEHDERHAIQLGLKHFFPNHYSWHSS